jgi:iron uptake system component EfeO
MFHRAGSICAAVVVGLAVTGCSGAQRSAAPAAPPTTRVTVSVGQCGTGWTHAVPGQQHFILHNTDTRAGEVLLTDASTAAVYADVEPLAAGTSTNLDIALGSGRYAFRCAMEDAGTVTGRPVTIPGSVRRPTTPVLPVTQADLIGATKTYEAYVSGRLPQLARLTTALRSDIQDGDLAAARRAWLPAHLAYERLGAAYDAFGDLDSAINGLPAGLPGGRHDREWAGFHRLEYGLWHGESAASLRAPAAALLASVQALKTQFAKAQIDPLTVSIRAHEITENALQFELTGETDFGSGSNLATTRANLDGTVTVLDIIRPLLTPRYSQLPVLTAALTRAQDDLDAVRKSGGWPPIGTLSTSQRERIDADLSQLSELLAPVASILEPRRAS